MAGQGIITQPKPKPTQPPVTAAKPPAVRLQPQSEKAASSGFKLPGQSTDTTVVTRPEVTKKVPLIIKKQYVLSFLLFISLIRMRSKRDIKMGRLCTPGGAVLGIVGGGVTFRFLNGEAILDENMLFWMRLYALVVVLKILLDFRL